MDHGGAMREQVNVFLDIFEIVPDRGETGALHRFKPGNRRMAFRLTAFKNGCRPQNPAQNKTASKADQTEQNCDRDFVKHFSPPKADPGGWV